MTKSKTQDPQVNLKIYGSAIRALKKSNMWVAAHIFD